MLSWLFDTRRQLNFLGNIGWIDGEVDRFFTQDMEALIVETKQVVQLATEAQKREQLGSTYLKSLSAINQAKGRMKITGYEELDKVQRQSNQVKGLKAKLLKAARG